jgi:hypothetical protein
MINKFDLAKALFNQSKSIADTNSLLLIPNGSAYEPDPNTTYIEEFVLYGNDTAIGLADCSSDIQLGVYQVNINTPKSNLGAKWRGLEIGGIMQEGFKRGTTMTFNGQSVRTLTSSLQPMDFNDTHETHILSVNYSVIN